MFKKLLLLISLFFIIISSAGLFAVPPLAYGATGIIPSPSEQNTASSCPPGYTGNCGNYALDDFIVLAINISKWILGIVGSLSLLMFIYGGISFLISAGSSEKIKKAKDIIIAAVIGLIIVFASWLMIRFVMQSIGLPGWEGQVLEWNGKILPKAEPKAK